MLGEAARTQSDVDFFFDAYENAIRKVGEKNALLSSSFHEISIKLSAIHQRYEATKKDRVTSELLERVYELCLQSAQHDIALTIDAEEQDRLELSLYLIKELASIVGVIAGIFLAKNYYPYLDLKLKPIFESDANFISILSATVIFLITIMLFKIIAKILTKLLKIIALGLLNRIIGSVFGVIKTILLLCIVVFIFSNINRLISIIEAEKLNQSFFYPKIEKINNLIIESNYRENGNEE